MPEEIKPASTHHQEMVLWVRHWTDALFSFAITRPQSFRFRSGEFVMIGLPGAGEERPVMRAYSIASPPWADELEFLSIKVPGGPLTSRLQKIQAGQSLLLGKKPTGSLTHDALLPGKNLYLLGTGTGLAPWLSVARDPETYERFEKVIVCHGVRRVDDLCYRQLLTDDIFNDEFLGDLVSGGRLVYYPTVTREVFYRQGRLTDLILSGRIFSEHGIDQIQFNPASDRVMVCGSDAMNKDMRAIFHRHGMQEGSNAAPGHIVFEKSFVERGPVPTAPSHSVSAPHAAGYDR